MEIRADNETYKIIDLPGREIVLSLTTLHPHKETKGHKHPWEEIYYFIDEAILTIDGISRLAEGGTFVRIAENSFHQVTNSTGKDIRFVCCWRKQP